MDHKIISGWMLLSLLMSTLVFSYPQVQHSNQIAQQYISKPMQHHTDYQNQQYLRHQQPQPRIIERYDVLPPSQYRDAEELQTQHYDRKFAEKPNALKKVSLDDIDNDIQTNQIDGNNAFSWTSMIGSLMQMFFNNANLGPTKSDESDGNGIPPSPWTNVIAVGKLNKFILFYKPNSFLSTQIEHNSI